MKPIELTVTVRNNRLKQARKLKGLSQAKLGVISGVGLEWVAQLECLHKIRFSRDPTRRKIQEERLYQVKSKLAECLDTTVEELFPDELDLVISNRVVRHIDVPTALALHTNSEVLKLESAERELFSARTIEGRTEIEKILCTLPDRHAQVIRLRFGIGTGYPRTLEEVGRIFNIRKERVGQIEARAIRELRHPSRSRPLRQYLD